MADNPIEEVKANDASIISQSDNFSKGVRVDVSNLSYNILLNKEIKVLLRNVNFTLEPGCMCALMGPSGAGKSTLLDILADRKLSGNWSGNILFNYSSSRSHFNSISAYILQDDLHIPTLTVEETIRYAAHLKLTSLFLNNQKSFTERSSMIEERILMLLNMMGLSHVKNNLVGDNMHKGISGGQLKRLSIAVEIITLPDLIFLDEPTSGLDSSIALEVMKSIRQLSNQNRTCISTIHQPSVEVFNLFDKVVLLSQGRVIFFGSCSESIEYFTGQNLGYRYFKSTNPAEFIIDVSEGRIVPEESNISKTSQELESLYKKSIYYSEMRVEERNIQDKSDPLLCSSISNLGLAAFHFFIISKRTWVSIVRDKDEVKAQLAKSVIVGFLIGLIFYGQANAESPLFEYGVPTANVTNVTSLLYFGLMFTLISNAQAIPFLCRRDEIFRRELASGTYAPFPYWLSLTLVVIPFQLVNHSIFIAITYFMCDFHLSFDYFFYFYVVMFLSNLSSLYFAMLLAAGTNDEKIAFTIFPITFLFLSTFAGYSIQINDIPPFWSWIAWIDYARWAFEGLMVNQWTLFADDDAVNPFFQNGNGNVLELYGFQDYDKNNSYWIILVIISAMMLTTLYFMQPPINRLEKVDNASDQLALPESQEPSSQQIDLENSQSLNNSLLLVHESLLSTNSHSMQNSHSWLQSSLEGDSPKGCNLLFRDITYSVSCGDGEVQILHGISGRAQSSEMVALMGSSGAGKSTLLDILAGRKTVGSISGQIYFNGERIDSGLSTYSAYVMQENVHIGILTVRETLLYAAQLRMKESLPLNEKEERVDKILQMLGLESVANSIVGTPYTRGISGGQLKRLSIGVEIINLPRLIFLDEPTTGLDSAIAFEVMHAVRKIANKNRTVVCTIHQPSIQTFLLFDKLLLLSYGKTIYFGPSNQALFFFQDSPFRFPFYENQNPAEYFIAIAGSFLNSDDGECISAELLSKHYLESEHYELFSSNFDSIIKHDKDKFARDSSTFENDEEPSLKYYGQNSFSTSVYNQTQVLLHRQYICAIKNYTVTLNTFLRHIIIGIFYGTIYYQLADGSDPTVYSNRLALFFFALLFLISGQQQLIPELQEDRIIFYRERSANAVDPLAYWLSKNLIKIPFDVLNVFLFSVLIYFLAGLNQQTGNFAFFFMIMLQTDLIGLFICQIVSGIAPNSQTAMSYFPVSLFFSTAFAGFIVYLPEFPNWLGDWAPYISFLRYSFQALTLNEFVGNGGNLPEESTYIDMLGFDSLTKYECAPILVIFVVIYGLLSFWVLKYINFEKR